MDRKIRDSRYNIGYKDIIGRPAYLRRKGSQKTIDGDTKMRRKKTNIRRRRRTENVVFAKRKKSRHIYVRT